MHFNMLTSKVLLLVIALTPSLALILDDAQQPLRGPPSNVPHRIAIIGAGSAGASAAYYLNQYGSSSCLPLNITIFERSNYIGGRSTTIPVFNDTTQPVEVGASIFVSVNKNLVSTARALNLSLSIDDDNDDDDNEPQILGIWNGKEFVYTQALNAGYWSSWWQTAKLLYRYGVTAPWRTKNLMQSTVSSFLQLYEAPHFPFPFLTSAIYAVGLHRVMSMTGRDFLAANGVKGGFAEEIVQASTRVNYAQDLGSLHAVEAMVCMATDGAMNVRGGNWRIFDGMVKKSGAALRLGVEVVRVEKTEAGRYMLSSVDVEGNEEEVREEFDAVILAAPYHQSRIVFEPAHKQPFLPRDIPYVNLHVTLFSTPYSLSPEYFSLPSTSSVPSMILTTPEADAPHKPDTGIGDLHFFSLSNVRSARNPLNNNRVEKVFKIFSDKPVDPAQLEQLISASSSTQQSALNTSEHTQSSPISWLHHHTWLSYPYLPPVTGFDMIKLGVTGEDSLGRGIWYTSGIESFISTMETSSLSGMNVARLIVDELLADGAGANGEVNQGRDVKWKSEI